MRIKFIDFLFVSILTIGTGTTVYNLSSSKKIGSALLASVTSTIAGLYVVGSKQELESKINTLIDVSGSDRETAESADSSQIGSESSLVERSSSSLDSIVTLSPNSEYAEIATPERKKVIQWLESLGITVNNYYQAQSSDDIYNRLSLTLGESFQHLEKLYQQIKRKLSTGEKFTLNLSGKPQQYIGQNTFFCSQLHNYGFLVNYRYLASNKIIIASTSRTGDAINFFTGQWFERFVYLKIARLLTQHELDYQCLINSEIITREGLNFELDIVFLIDEKPVWVECKTGQYQNYIHKYSQFRNSLNIGKERSFLVILGINDKLCQELTKMYDLTVTNENLFIQDIGKNLAIDEPIPLEETPVELKKDRRIIRITTGTIRDEYDIIKALKKLKLRPAPEWRSIVFDELIKIVDRNTYNPTRFKDIRETLFLADRGISKTILIDILNTLIMAECLIDSTGRSLYSYNQNLSSLVGNRVDALEQRCLEVYALVVWLIDPEFLTSLSNLEVLKKATGVDNLDSLDLEKIEEMADRINNSQNIISTVNFAFDNLSPKR